MIRCCLTLGLMQGISDGIAWSQSLNQIILPFNGIEDASAIYLIQAIQKNNEHKDDKTWKTSLWRWKMSLAEVSCFEAMTNKTEDNISVISTLDLSSNFITCEFLKVFAKTV